MWKQVFLLGKLNDLICFYAREDELILGTSNKYAAKFTVGNLNNLFDSPIYLKTFYRQNDKSLGLQCPIRNFKQYLLLFHNYASWNYTEPAVYWPKFALWTSLGEMAPFFGRNREASPDCRLYTDSALQSSRVTKHASCSIHSGWSFAICSFCELDV